MRGRVGRLTSPKQAFALSSPGTSRHTASMNLTERLAADIKSAMLARETETLGALRMLKSAIGYAEIERKTAPLSDGDFVVVVQKEVKKRKDSIDAFVQGNRPELADRERQEIAVLETFLPKALSPTELEEMVRS